MNQRALDYIENDRVSRDKTNTLLKGHKPWSVEDDNKLKSLLGRPYSISYIATLFNRSPCAIICRLQKHALLLNSEFVDYAHSSPNKLFHCNTHQRRATHMNVKSGELCCDPTLGGIMLSCGVVDLTNIVEITYEKQT